MFESIFKDLLKALEIPLEGLLKGFERPLNVLLKAFKMHLQSRKRPLHGFFKAL